jgi:ABC-type nitrate/sulfonate/bicarbonate transport system substrate-binding protein
MKTSIEYGVPTNRCGLQIRLGIEKGFFRDEGVDLAVRIVFGGAEIAAEFDSGRLPIGELGTPPCLTAIAKGAHFKIVGSSIRRGAVQYLVVHPRIAGWDGLRRTRLGVLNRGSCSDWYMRKVLAHHSIDPDNDVSVVALGPRYPDVLELLAHGEIDGAILSEPHVTIGEQAGLFKVWLGLNAVDFVPRMQWSVVVANNDMLARQPDAVAAVLRACRRSYRYAACHRDEWTEFGARYFDISSEVMTKSVDREFDDLHFDGEIDKSGLAAAIALQEKLGAIASPLSMDEIVDARFTSASLAMTPAKRGLRRSPRPASYTGQSGGT